MARIKLAYIGGGSMRAPGVIASLVVQGENFQLAFLQSRQQVLIIVKTHT
jgi:alpha-galactosidase/6-phospho-beta-glucosidase family protein